MGFLNCRVKVVRTEECGSQSRSRTAVLIHKLKLSKKVCCRQV